MNPHVNPRDPHYPNRADWLTRPARRQVDDATLQKEIQARGGYGETNLWSGRRIGPSGPSGDSKRSGPRSKDLSKYRCVLELDVGRTRGSDAKQHMFCLYFAKGCCSQGSACTYLHRLPTADDEAYAVRDLSADIFGREKRAENEGYRKGAGTLERDNRTLYVNYEGAGGYDLPKLRQLVDANFRAFGPINNIYIVHAKTIAFVRYDWRSSAEFAKEAMHKQSLVGSTLGEVVTVRWANEDPNPVAVLAQKRACEEAFGRAVMSTFDALPPEQKQARIMELQLQGSLQRGTSIGNYPSTDGQFEERERLQQELELRQQQQQEEEEEEDIPYIPPDIYEEQQRLVAQQREAATAAAAAASDEAAAAGGAGDAGQQAAAVAKGPTGYGAASAGLAAAQTAAASVAMTPLELMPPADTEAEAEAEADADAAQGPGDFGAEPRGSAGVTSEAAEWERAWADPELREKMRADPELRERMRRKRNEAVYWSAYQAHYSAYANSYGPQASDAQQAAGQGYSWPTGYAWYGQQGWGEGAQASWGYSEYGAQPAYGAGAEAAASGGAWYEGQVEAVAGSVQGQGSSGLDNGGQATGGGGGGGADGAVQEEHVKESGSNLHADGLSLLGTAYGSDDEDDS